MFTFAPKSGLPVPHPSIARAPGARPASATPPRTQELADDERPLDDRLRRPMERFFRHSFDRVRVFSGDASRRAAEAYGAYAFTRGQEIHLGERARSLPADRHRALLAHEIVHTMQQRGTADTARPGTLAAEAADTPAERQASGLARAFGAHERDPAAGAALRDRLGAPVVSPARLQLARVGTHFGEFEDANFATLSAGAGSSVPTGTELGVQVRMRFHPGPNVDATKIGLTQAIDTVIAGTRATQHPRTLRLSAARGPGTGYHIDTPADRTSPMYQASGTPRTGAPPDELGSYDAPGIAPAPASGPFRVGRNNVIGLTGGGGSVYGFRFMRDGALRGPSPAELHDAPQDPTASPSSSQSIETAALAMEGTMAGTYLGSVRWGWRRDARGAFTAVPVALGSRGVPSADFLTAASVWNPATENIVYEATAAAVPVIGANSPNPVLATVGRGTRMQLVATGTMNGTAYLLVEVVGPARVRGLVEETHARQVDVGRPTVDLPLPRISTVTLAAGVVLDGEHRCAPNDPLLPQGTRVRELGPFGDLASYVRVEVVDGPFTSRRGVLRRSALTPEPLGTR